MLDESSSIFKGVVHPVRTVGHICTQKAPRWLQQNTTETETYKEWSIALTGIYLTANLYC